MVLRSQGGGMPERQRGEPGGGWRVRSGRPRVVGTPRCDGFRPRHTPDRPRWGALHVPGEAGSDECGRSAAPGGAVRPRRIWLPLKHRSGRFGRWERPSSASDPGDGASPLRQSGADWKSGDPNLVLHRFAVPGGTRCRCPAGDGPGQSWPRSSGPRCRGPAGGRSLACLRHLRPMWCPAPPAH